MPSESAKKRQAQKKERERQRQKQASTKAKQKADQANGACGGVNGDSEGACAAAVGSVAAEERDQTKVVSKKIAARSCTGQLFSIYMYTGVVYWVCAFILLFLCCTLFFNTHNMYNVTAVL